jgi:hypothetical protein
MEIYLISVAIGLWQLGSIVSYTIHTYCDIMERLYDVLVYLGISESSTAECTQIQASLPGNLIIIIGSFFILVISFLFQASAQYKKNIADCMKYVDNRDIPRFSMAWSRGKGNNSRGSIRTASLSLSQILEDDETRLSSRVLSSSPGSSNGLCRATSTGSRTSDNDGGFGSPSAALSPAVGLPDMECPSSPALSCAPPLAAVASEPAIHSTAGPGNCIAVAFRLTSPRSSDGEGGIDDDRMTVGNSSSWEDTGGASIIDAPCEWAPTPPTTLPSPNSDSGIARRETRPSGRRNDDDDDGGRPFSSLSPPAMPHRLSMAAETNPDLEIPSVPSPPPRSTATSSPRSRGSLLLPRLRSTATRQASPSPSRLESVRRLTNSSDYLHFMDQHQQPQRQEQQQLD